MIDAATGRDRSDGLLTPTQIAALVTAINRNSGGTSRASTVVGGAGGIYQVSYTLYDAVGRDDRRHLLARLLQLFAPGIPQVPYVGLLAGSNKPDLVARERSIAAATPSPRWTRRFGDPWSKR
jgi:sucrose phosphorylase